MRAWRMLNWPPKKPRAMPVGAGVHWRVANEMRTERAPMARRVAEQTPAQPGIFTRAEVTYALREANGSAALNREAVAFAGEAEHQAR
jgi:hypothetical protein